MSTKREALAALTSHLAGLPKLYPGDPKLRFGVGNPDAQILVLGEAPSDSDEPLQGPQDRLLQGLFTRLKHPPEEFYFTNIVKYTPPENRQPTDEEMTKHGPYLAAEIKIIQPGVILALGRQSVSFLSGVEGRMSDIRAMSRLTYVDSKSKSTIPVVPSWNPSYVIYRAKSGDRSPLEQLISDVRKALDLSKGAR